MYIFLDKYSTKPNFAKFKHEKRLKRYENVEKVDFSTATAPKIRPHHQTEGFQ